MLVHGTLLARILANLGVHEIEEGSYRGGLVQNKQSAGPREVSAMATAIPKLGTAEIASIATANRTLEKRFSMIAYWNARALSDSGSRLRISLICSATTADSS